MQERVKTFSLSVLICVALMTTPPLWHWFGLKGGVGGAWVYPWNNNDSFWLAIKQKPTPAFLITLGSVLTSAALTPHSVFFVWLWLVHFRSRRTLQGRWHSGWPMPLSSSTSSSRTETWVASHLMPKTSSHILSRWPSSQSVCGCERMWGGVGVRVQQVKQIILNTIDFWGLLDTKSSH